MKKYSNNAEYNTAQLSFKRKLLLYYVRFTIFCKLSVLLLCILFLFTTLFDPFKKSIIASTNQFLAQHGFVLKDIIIESQQHISNDKLYQIMNLKYGEPIFDISLEEVRQRLESNMWIKKAIIARKVPSSLYIAILEYLPL
jgi:cell division septal protein FtsQ